MTRMPQMQFHYVDWDGSTNTILRSSKSVGRDRKTGKIIVTERHNGNS